MPPSFSTRCCILLAVGIFLRPAVADPLAPVLSGLHNNCVVHIFEATGASRIESAWISTPVAEPGTSAALAGIAESARDGSWTVGYDPETGCENRYRFVVATGGESSADLFDDALATGAGRSAGDRPPSVVLLELQRPREGWDALRGGEVLPYSSPVAQRFVAESGAPFFSATRRWSARPEQSGTMQPAAELLVRGPRYESALGAPFILGSAKLWRDFAEDGIDLELIHRPDGLFLTFPLIDEDLEAASADLLKRARRHALGGISTSEAARLRDQLALQRALSFEEPLARLAFLARRLRFAPAEAVFAEDAALRASTSADIERALAAAFAEPQWQLALAATPGAEKPTAASESARIATALDEDFALIHAPTAPGGLVAVCIMVPLPGGVGPSTTKRAGIWPFRHDIEVPDEPLTREEAALLWRAKFALAAADYPELAARTAAALPAPLAGLSPDPFASNQFSSIVLSGEAGGIDDLLRFAAAILDQRPSARVIEAILDELGGALNDGAIEEYQRTLAAQRALVASTPAFEIMERRASAIAGLLEGDRDAQKRLRRQHDRLLRGGPIVIGVAAPARDSDHVDDFAVWMRARGYGAAQMPPPWSLPATGAVSVEDARTGNAEARLSVALTGDEVDMGALLLLNQSIVSASGPRIGGVSAYPALRPAVLNFPGGAAWVVGNGLNDSESLRRQALAGLEAVAEAAGGDPDAFAEGAERLLRWRASSSGRARQRAFLLARDYLLYADPGRRDATARSVDTADAERLAALARLLGGRLESLSIQSEQ